MRDAYNGALFVEYVEKQIGLSLQVLDGEREAYYGTLGALNEVPMSAGYVVDSIEAVVDIQPGQLSFLTRHWVAPVPVKNTVAATN